MKDELLHLSVEINTNIPKQNIFIIGAGLPRTGTTSLSVALADLGFNAYHSRTALIAPKNEANVFVNAFNLKAEKKKEQGLSGLQTIEHWEKLTLNDKEINWNDVYHFDENKYDAALTISSALYMDLMQQYPNYKVILTVRDNSNKWCESIAAVTSGLHTVLNRFGISIVHKLTGFNSAVVAGPQLLWWTHEEAENEEYMTQFYDNWNEKVKRTVPKDKLLVFNVKQGWKPLCDFLGVAEEHVPNKPFPRANDRVQMMKMQRRMNRMVDLIQLSALTLIGVAAYYGWKKYKKQ
eukprot:14494_1